jgi:hypothetical protein
MKNPDEIFEKENMGRCYMIILLKHMKKVEQ